MKATQTLPVSALSYKPIVKIYLIRGFRHLVSEHFSTFILVLADVITFIGFLNDDDNLIAYGGIVFLLGFTPFAIRETINEFKTEGGKK